MPGARDVPADVKAFLDAVENDRRRQDSFELLELMQEATGETPYLWGSIVGFGTYHYKYESGREGDAGKLGFSPRKQALTIYFLSGLAGYEDLLARLGPHTTGKSCLYIRRLEDVDREVLSEMMRRSAEHIDQAVEQLGAVPRMADMPPYQDS